MWYSVPGGLALGGLSRVEDLEIWFQVADGFHGLIWAMVVALFIVVLCSITVACRFGLSSVVIMSSEFHCFLARGRRMLVFPRLEAARFVV